MMRSIVAQEHGNGCRGDDDVANPAENIGNLTEDEIAENCRKDNLAIVIDGNFSGGGVGIGCGDGELTGLPPQVLQAGECRAAATSWGDSGK